MEIGDEIVGSKLYGKKNTLKGVVVDIKHPENEGLYKLNDIVTIQWDNGVITKFYYKHL